MSPHTPQSITSGVIRILALISGYTPEDLTNQLDASTTFDTAGIDSLDILDAYFEIEREYGIRVPQLDWAERKRIGRTHDAYGNLLHTLPSLVTEIYEQLSTEDVP